MVVVEGLMEVVEDLAEDFVREGEEGRFAQQAG